MYMYFVPSYHIGTKEHCSGAGSDLAIVGHYQSYLAIIGHYQSDPSIIGRYQSDPSIIGHYQSDPSIISRYQSDPAIIGDWPSTQFVVVSRITNFFGTEPRDATGSFKSCNLGTGTGTLATPIHKTLDAENHHAGTEAVQVLK